MIFGNNRDELRRMYRDAWRKHCESQLLSPLEAQIAGVVGEHPEYRETVETVGDDGSKESPQNTENPFLHMGLHLAIRDQVKTNRPPGIAAEYARLVARADSAHAAEHGMMAVLADALWDAQQSGSAPDEQAYLERLRRL